MPYCSTECLDKDKNTHGALCDSFKDFQVRPGKDTYRAIHFPENGENPTFVWLEFISSEVIARSEKKKYFGDSSVRSVEIDDDKRFLRPFKHALEVWHHDNFLLSGDKINQSLLSYSGQTVAFWRGPLIACGRKYSDDYEKFEAGEMVIDPEDQIGGEEIPYIAMDLDTTSLGPIIAALKFRANSNALSSLGLAASIEYTMRAQDGQGVELTVGMKRRLASAGL